MRAWFALGLAGGATLLVGCRAPTEIRVDVFTDLPCDPEDRGQELVAGSIVEDARAFSAVSSGCESGSLGSVVLSPSGGKSAEVAFSLLLESQSRDSELCIGLDTDPDGVDPNDPDAPQCVWARRALRYVQNEQLRVRIDLSQSCVNLPCELQTTCVSARCVDKRIEAPEQCIDAPCGDEVLGEPARSPDPTPANSGRFVSA